MSRCWRGAGGRRIVMERRLEDSVVAAKSVSVRKRSGQSFESRLQVAPGRDFDCADLSGRRGPARPCNRSERRRPRYHSHQFRLELTIKNTLKAIGTIALTGTLFAGSAAERASAAPNFQFPITVSKGAAKCLPHAFGRATVSTLGPIENLHVEVAGLPKRADFDFFVIQVPNKPFGLSWYQGDIETDEHGVGVGDFTGRFSVESFIVAPGVAAAPQSFTRLPFPDAKQNPATAPVQTYHLGLWFNSPGEAARAGCPTDVTPFNGTHNAGIQAMNTGLFPDTQGPLINVR